ncbi:hypothetical protein BDR05DRAFT_958508, partial [Suillus weaverae]
MCITASLLCAGQRTNSIWFIFSSPAMSVLSIYRPIAPGNERQGLAGLCSMNSVRHRTIPYHPFQNRALRDEFSQQCIPEVYIHLQPLRTLLHSPSVPPRTPRVKKKDTDHDEDTYMLSIEMRFLRVLSAVPGHVGCAANHVKDKLHTEQAYECGLIPISPPYIRKDPSREKRRTDMVWTARNSRKEWDLA